ncbi:Regulator of rDNA transcription protein, partial [Quillaja saponaria]
RERVSGQVRVRVRVRKTDVSIEDYEYFSKNPYYEGFSYDQLNQNDLYEALSTIDFQKLQRSTIGESFLPYGSALTVDQVKQDLKALGWHECSVQSVQTVNPTTDDNNPPVEILGANGVSKNFTATSFKVGRRQLRPKKSRTTGSDIGREVNGFLTSPFTISIKRKRSKRKGRRMSFGNEGGDAVGNAWVSNGVGFMGAEPEKPVFVDTYSWEF